MTRTQWGIVLGLLCFILIIFGVLLFQLQVPPAAPPPPPPAFLLEEGAQAKTVLPIAQQEAQSWQADAYLAAVSIVWDDLGPGGILKRDRWAFEFFSPSQQQMIVIRVVDGAAQRLRTGLMPNRLPALPLDQWQIDSSQALQTWWQQGGGDFVQQHTLIFINLKLRPALDSAHPIWTVAGSASGQHWVVQINGQDGSVLQ